MIGYLTLGEMSDMVARHIQDTSSARAIKIKERINGHYFDFAGRYRWPQLMQSEEAAVTFASNAAYVYLPPTVDQLYLILPGNQDSIATPLSMEALMQQLGANSQNSGLFDQYADAGEFSRRFDFLAGGEQLSVAQTGYTTTSTAMVSGLIGDTAGKPTSAESVETVTVSATAGVYTNLTSGSTYYDITGFSAASNASGTYLLKGVTSGTIYAVIGTGDTTVRYRRVRISMGPAITVTMFWKKRVKRLTQDSQTIEIPVAYALVDKTIATMYSSQREYNQAMQYHDMQAEQACEKAFHGTTVEGERIELGQPTINVRNHRIIVVNGP